MTWFNPVRLVPVKFYVPKPNRTLGTLDYLGLVGLVGLLVARYIPVAKLIPFWGCVLRERTGWPCLGCGLTRAADHVAHFKFGAAFAANPLGTVAAFFFAFAAVVTVLHLAFKMPVPEVRLSPREWLAVKVAAPLLLLANYAYVVVATRFPHLLA